MIVPSLEFLPHFMVVAKPVLTIVHTVSLYLRFQLVLSESLHQGRSNMEDT